MGEGGLPRCEGQVWGKGLWIAPSVPWSAPLGRMFKMAGVLMGHEFCMASDPAKLLPGTAAREIGINMNQRQARCTPKFTKDGLPLTH